jgi:hypothetical protein
MAIGTAIGAAVLMTILHFAGGWPDSFLKVALYSVAGGIGGGWAAKMKADRAND